MELNSWPGLIAVILAVISFYGTTYLVIALNVGWRFGYWLASATFGALMVLLSLFWVVNVKPDQAVGPQGKVPIWIPIAAGETIDRAEYEGEPLTSLGQYPGGAWEQAESDDPNVETFGSSVSNCLSLSEDALEGQSEPLKTACEQAQELMPATTDIPVIEGAPVAVVPEVTEVRFTDDHGRLAQAVVSPVTTDPRVTDDPDGVALAEPFRVAAILDEGSIGLPSLMSLVIFTIYAAFHLWGLNRAEKRKLQPASI